MAFYIKTDDGRTLGGGAYYVAENLAGHWGPKTQGTTYDSSTDAQTAINAKKDGNGTLYGRSNPQPVEE